MHPILIHPGVPQEKFTAEDIYERKTGMDVYEPSRQEDVKQTLEEIDEPVAFVCANQTWSHTYLDVLSNQDWVTTIGAGYDRYAVDEFVKREITFTNTAGIHDQPIGEHVFGLLFALSRGLFGYYEQQQEAVWKRNTDTTDFAGETCCIVGLGRIGEELARRARAFDMHVRGVKRTVNDYDGKAHEVYPADKLHNALQDARIVIACVPLSPATEDLLDYDALSNCNDDAIIVNVARGQVVNTEALLTLLDDAELGTAVLDVFDTEPLPPTSPLWEREDVIVTPHAAATTDKATDRILSVFLEQYERWTTDAEMHNVIAP